MAELLGIGMPHAPMFQFPDAAMAGILRKYIERGIIPPRLRDPSSWPAAMQAEWGDDEGLTAAAHHRGLVVDALRTARAELDAFAPDVVVVFGDDQYENFREDVVPAFCVYAFDALETLPYRGSSMVDSPENVWGKDPATTVTMHGHRDAGIHLASELLRAHFDVAWATRPHHHPTLGHAFLRTMMYLDYDQRSFPYAVVPFHVNAYGADIARDVTLADGNRLEVAPPAPTPRRCFDLGVAVGRILRASPYRVAVVGSSSWSHAFLTQKHHLLHPDIESDRARLAELEASNHAAWADLELSDLRDAGQHELLNWICMAGAMAEASAEVLCFADTHIFNSTKVVAVLRG